MRGMAGQSKAAHATVTRKQGTDKEREKREERGQRKKERGKRREEREGGILLVLSSCLLTFLVLPKLAELTGRQVFTTSPVKDRLTS